jgi:hypothetical protein
MELDQEIAYFEENRAELLAAYAGKFALIRGSALFGVYDTAEEAWEEALKRFGKTPFLVAHVTETFLRVPLPDFSGGP